MTSAENSDRGIPKPRTKKSPDFILLLTVFALVGFGVVMVSSSSSYSALVRFGDSFYYLKRQALWALAGLAVMLMVQKIDYWFFRRHARLFLILALLLLALSLVPGVGVEARGSRRSIVVGPLSVSPAELVKLCLVIYLAHTFCRVPQKMKSFLSGVAPPLVVVGAAVAMVILQPDLGTAVTISGTVMILLFAAGARLVHLLAMMVVATPAVYHLIMSEDYRYRRFLAFLDPWADPLGAGFHIIQSLYALGSGRLLGVGLGGSHQKFLHLPEQHTDFIFAIVGEELGFLGSGLLLILFLIFAWRGFSIAAHAPDRFSTLLATGITVMIILQVVINVGVVTSVLPITGIPLPFISYGGSSLLVVLASTGILLNISSYCRV